MDELELKDWAVRIWIRCDQNCVLARHVVSQDPTLTHEERAALISLLNRLEECVNA